MTRTKCPPGWEPGCCCSVIATEPDWNCWIHGDPDHRRCPYCNMFVKPRYPCKNCGYGSLEHAQYPDVSDKWKCMSDRSYGNTLNFIYYMERYLNALEYELKNKEEEYDPYLYEVQASCMLMSYGGHREIFDISPTSEHFDVLALAVEICKYASKNDISLGYVYYCVKLLDIMALVIRKIIC